MDGGIDLVGTRVRDVERIASSPLPENAMNSPSELTRDDVAIVV